MDIEDTTEIGDLTDFTDQEILKATKYRCIRDSLNSNCFIYIIKLGKIVFTVKISPEDPHSLLDDHTKHKLARSLINFLLTRVRQKTGSYSNNFLN